MRSGYEQADDSTIALVVLHVGILQELLKNQGI